MIKLEKRLMPCCEDCEMFAPSCFKLREKTEDNKSFNINTVIVCQHADICSNAIHQYQKTPIIERSPCIDCSADHASCCGCEKYSNWRAKYD